MSSVERYLSYKDILLMEKRSEIFDEGRNPLGLKSFWEIGLEGERAEMSVEGRILLEEIDLEGERAELSFQGRNPLKEIGLEGVRSLISSDKEERCFPKSNAFILKLYEDMSDKSSLGRRAVQYSSKYDDSTDEFILRLYGDMSGRRAVQYSSKDDDSADQQPEANDFEEQEKRRANEREKRRAGLKEDVFELLEKAKRGLEENPQWINFFQELDEVYEDFDKEENWEELYQLYLESGKLFQDLKTEVTAWRALSKSVARKIQIWYRVGYLLSFGVPIAMFGWIIFCKRG